MGITIVDNGLGITRENLKNIRQKLNSEGDYSNHIGLFNTNKRLRQAFGEAYGIKINSKSVLGTAIYINIPINNASHI
jgi:two-component system, sensor histidine kinase YesM